MGRKKKERDQRQAQKASHSTITQHHRHGKTLTPPLVAIPKLMHSSWIDNRLPEMLWAALLITNLERGHALAVFREVAGFVGSLRGEEPPYDVTHTGLSQQKEEVSKQLLSIVVGCNESRRALRPLLLLHDLPLRDQWGEVIGEAATKDDWATLEAAIARTLFHQSQEATDCRWVRVLCRLAGGKLMLPSREMAHEFFYYPDYGDMTRVRPTIRAIEISVDQGDEKIAIRKWSDKFWGQCLSDTLCFALPGAVAGQPAAVGTTTARLNEVFGALVQHCNNTRSTTATDARHDTVFGIGLYSLSILRELLRVGASSLITARVALRVIVESLITLTYLSIKDKSDLWNSYRVFGAGQAKLAYLKLEELGDTQGHVNSETLKALANEDVWEEFLPIELGHWEKADLRRLSIEAGLKDEYDRFYIWSSAFVHGHWGAVRDAVFDTCGNALHRLHRIPRASARLLPEVLPDACGLTDRILDVVARLYPDFPQRVTVAHEQQSG